MKKVSVEYIVNSSAKIIAVRAWKYEGHHKYKLLVFNDGSCNYFCDKRLVVGSACNKRIYDTLYRQALIYGNATSIIGDILPHIATMRFVHVGIA